MSNPNKPRPAGGLPKPRYVDRPEVNETYADSLERIFLDGKTIRLEFVVHRFDDPKPPAQPTGKAYTACRVVMPVASALEMFNKLNQLQAAMAQITQGQSPSDSVN